MNAITKQLPICTGASLGDDSGGGRAEKITTEKPGEVRSAAPKEQTLTPAQRAAFAPAPVVPSQVPAAAPSQVVDASAAALDQLQEVSDEEIVQLHARFDRLEALLKRRLAIATLSARFDNLEKWLNDRF